MRHRPVIAAIAAVLALSGCGEVSGALGDGDGREPGAAMVTCGSSTYDPAELADAPSAASLPQGPADAVDDAGQPALDAPSDWTVVGQSDERVELIRELDEPLDMGSGDVRTHESRTLERITGAPNVAEGTWLLTSAGPCTPRVSPDRDLGEADLTLAAAPAPEDTAIDLLVHERACASGQSAEGRIELVELTETDTQVQVHIGVRPPEGDAQTCPSNPPTPFTVELDEPLGDREVVDTSVIPPRPVRVQDGQ